MGHESPDRTEDKGMIGRPRDQVGCADFSRIGKDPFKEIWEEPNQGFPTCDIAGAIVVFWAQLKERLREEIIRLIGFGIPDDELMVFRISP